VKSESIKDNDSIKYESNKNVNEVYRQRSGLDMSDPSLNQK